MKLKYMTLVLLFTASIVFPCIQAEAAYTRETNYTYNFWGQDKRSIAAFELEDIIDGGSLGKVRMSSADDVFAAGERIFIVDSAESRVNVLDPEFNLITSIKLVRNKDNKIVVIGDNKQLMLNQPEGVFLSEKFNELYIADTGEERIIVLDGDKYYLKRIIEKPANMVGDTLFKPSKIVVDETGRILTVVQDGYEGILELDKNGSFSRYFGVNKPKVDIIDYFWRSFASDEQKKKMEKLFAPSFNNVDIDEEGFVYAVTYDDSAKDKVFRLNSKGENVLVEKGYFTVTGDMQYLENKDNEFIDIAVTDYGVYAVLDRNTGRIFIYNFDGFLINIFNKNGNLKGNLKEAGGIEWLDKKLIVTDRQLACMFVFQPTEFGRIVLEAEELYFKGKFNEAIKLFQKAIKLNSNYDLAYINIGKNHLLNDNYKEAMYYFKLGNSRSYYSQAYKYYRAIKLQENFGWLFAFIIITALLILYSEYRYNKKTA